MAAPSQFKVTVPFEEEQLRLLGPWIGTGVGVAVGVGARLAAAASNAGPSDVNKRVARTR